jgi:4-amino-4-deoxychorismate lyase
MESTLRRGAGTPGLRLIETLGWDGAALTRLDLHLARLAGAAALLGWACDLDLVRAALAGAVPTTQARVRLTLDALGKVDVTVAEMPATATEWRVGLAAVPLASGDAWLSVKSTNRAAYDLARANLAVGLDEVIFLNELDEVCDGSITTVFFDAGQGLCTPPLICGLLPGVLRAELLAVGLVREAVLHASDLGRVQLWVGNSLRGLIPALFVEAVGA